MAVPIERQPMLAGFIWRDREGLRQQFRGIERSILARWRRERAGPTPKRYSLVGEALIRIVRPQGQAVFGPRREHPIRLGDATGHESSIITPR